MKRQAKAFAAMLAVAALSASPALAASNVGELAQSWVSQLSQFKAVIGVISYLAAFGIGMMGILKLKAASKNPNDPNNKVSTGLAYIAAAALLIALPTLLGVGVSSFFGSSSGTIDGSGFDLNLNLN